MNYRKQWMGGVKFFVLLITLSGCGYSLSGAGKSQLPSYVHSLSIPVFINGSGQPEIHRDLTDEVRRAFISDGRIRVVDKENGDLLLKGTLNYYAVRAISFNANDLVSEYWVEIGVAVVVTDTVKGKKFLSQNMKSKWNYRVTDNVVTTEQARKDALSQSYNDLSARMVSLLIDRF
ncbi:MAG: hypothetical protein COV66_00715 [Nitrospinae bacterium CG11_big_fil_rev_8_21_14_0_20_45_15]|nr:MAG: hypothetical protein COV66_00715 [Nitrospinae bacterium CG11_big_fil_rev_8_21_14_0_20_45_15]